MPKVAYNGQFGGFSLSEQACELLRERCPEIYAELDGHYGHLDRDDDRSEPHLVKVIEELGAEANGAHASLYVCNVPDGVPWIISEYDGSETVKIDWKALVAEAVSASELDEEIVRDRMRKALEWNRHDD